MVQMVRELVLYTFKTIKVWGAHWHPWKSGGQVKNDARPLTNEMKKLINKIVNFKK